MATEKPKYQEMPEAVRDSMEGRLFRYKRNLDIYRIEEFHMPVDDEEEIYLVAYNLNVGKRFNLFYGDDLGGIEFVDEDSEGLAKAIRESFTSQQ